MAIPSPVHVLQHELAALEQAQVPVGERKLPGWFRIGFPVVTSASLWALLLWTVGLIG